MSLTFNEIRLAALAGKTFTLTGVRIRELGIDENGIKIEYLMPNASNYQPDAPLDFISIDKPKHDPCRMFKKGDIVRLKEWNGRCPEMYSGTNSWFNHPPRCKNGNLEVREDEKNSKVEIGIIGADCAHAATAPAYLELVTPVEELEPYYVVEYEENIQIRRNPNGIEVARYDRALHPNAKAAAEAERDRLNAEYRKEQNNG